MPEWMKTALWAVVAGAVTGLVVVGYSAISKPSAPTAQFSPATDAAPKASAVAVKIKSGTVKVKKGAEASLKIPVDPDEGVIAASRIEANDHPTTVATIINQQTGDTRTVVREEPLPWLGRDTHGEVGLYYGMRGSEPGVVLQAKQELFQIKAIRVGVIGKIEQSALRGADTYIGVGAWYRW